MLEGTLSGSKGEMMIRAAHSESVFYAFLLLFFVLATNVTMMGVLGGLLVRTVMTVAEVEKEESTVRSMQQTMEDLWKVICAHDEDNDDCISAHEMRTLLKDKKTVKTLQNMGVDLEGLVNVSGFMFEQHDGLLTKPQFKRFVLDLRGKNAAKVKDHVETRKFVHALLKRSGMVRPSVRFE
mmetsp:Transcript_53971/g.167063  ORF Transcript_53971/g.167063 Transcript_53971/m.167063 type:complete len:181 (+) Transcript_53971:2-544(+)